MKQGSILFLKVVIVLIAFGMLTALIWEPQIEGRNIHSDPISLYFNDPFLAYIYISFVPFFIALYQAFKLLGYIDKDRAFSRASVKAVRNIKYCAIVFVAFIVAAEAYLFIAVRGKDDIAGGVAIGLVITFISTVIAIAAAVFQKLLQNAIDLKFENDLTV